MAAGGVDPISAIAGAVSSVFDTYGIAIGGILDIFKLKKQGQLQEAQFQATAYLQEEQNEQNQISKLLSNRQNTQLAILAAGFGIIALLIILKVKKG